MWYDPTDREDRTQLTQGRNMVQRVQPPRLANSHYMPPGAQLHVYRHQNVDSSGLHWHEFYELMVVLDGAGIHWLNGHRYDLLAGSFCLLSPSDFHEVVPLPGATLDFWNIIFTDALLGDALNDLLFEHEILLYTEVDAELGARLNFDCQRLWEETRQPGSGSSIVVQARLDCLLVELHRQLLSQHGPRLSSGMSTPIRRALRYIQRHFREPLSLTRVANQAQLSPAYFSYTFRRTTGITFQSYVLQLRLQFAARMLAASELPITDICFAAGFSSLSHFMRSFKNAFGCAPGSYRQTVLAARPLNSESETYPSERSA
jgi:AraC-like DNA-binding protein